MRAVLATKLAYWLCLMWWLIAATWWVSISTRSRLGVWRRSTAWRAASGATHPTVRRTNPRARHCDKHGPHRWLAEQMLIERFHLTLQMLHLRWSEVVEASDTLLDLFPNRIERGHETSPGDTTFRKLAIALKVSKNRLWHICRSRRGEHCPRCRAQWSFPDFPDRLLMWLCGKPT